MHINLKNFTRLVSPQTVRLGQYFVALISMKWAQPTKPAHAAKAKNNRLIAIEPRW